MKFKEVAKRCSEALERLTEEDHYLLEYDLSERCIASRVSFYLQEIFPEYSVDVEYNRVGKPAKRLNLPDECANPAYCNEQGESLVVPDVIIHQRGKEGQNLLVLEFKKKTNNPSAIDCDRLRVHAFRAQLGYLYGALVECETRKGKEPSICVSEWVTD